MPTRTAAALAALLATVAAGCSTPAETTTSDAPVQAVGDTVRGPVAIHGYTQLDPFTLNVTVASCGGAPALTSHTFGDDTAELVVEATTPVDGPGWMCLDSLVIVLDQTIDDQTVIDGHTGEQIDHDG